MLDELRGGACKDVTSNILRQASLLNSGSGIVGISDRPAGSRAPSALQRAHLEAPDLRMTCSIAQGVRQALCH